MPEVFTSEKAFESALCAVLGQKGWETEVLMNPTEEDLLQNWANILFANNRQPDRLNGCPLTRGETEQLLGQIRELRTPMRLNGFINGKTVSITRDNPEDSLHLGMEVSLKIFDRQEIALGSSRYQIARQPRFGREGALRHDRRGDLMLLINGMPIFHIELKRSGVHVSHAYNQIERYSREGVFTGLFALVQIFVAMNPEECVYFANPGPDGRFNPQYYFHWADVNNEPVNDWLQVAERLLSIPMAHQMLGFYTVADEQDGTLKVMRSYQYYAARAISDRVDRHKGHWEEGLQRGGYIWHTTGSGKTLTSFKAAQLIATSHSADKVVFLTDRIELGTQSLDEYRAFADDSLEVQRTENTYILLNKLKSNRPDDALIVTSIQKMSRIREDSAKAEDLRTIAGKKIVFVVDEAHRSTFGEMLYTIKHTLPNAFFFGFTGTPIYDENRRLDSTTADIFGDELHRYSIADGIRDRNVLGFDVHRVLTYRDTDLRRAVALEKVHKPSEEAALADPKTRERYLHWVEEVPMAGYRGADGAWVTGIEDLLPPAQYRCTEHRGAVVRHIRENRMRLSRCGRFHAILATSSIEEAIEYYRLFRTEDPDLKVTALYEPGTDTDDAERDFARDEATVQILADYNERYGKHFDLGSYGGFKKDAALRLAHKKHYTNAEHAPELQLDLLIVVDQMLTGFDSKWVNTLYLDKVPKYENIIQAFSRTNRLFGPDKPFGNIYYYRKPHTMERLIDEAVELYSGNRPTGVFTDRLAAHLRQMNEAYRRLREVFVQEGIEDFAALPQAPAARAAFAREFRVLNEMLQAAKVQGFVWEKLCYEDPETGEEVIVALEEQTYLVLARRYKELAADSGGDRGDGDEDLRYPIETYLTEIDVRKIDEAYLNERFRKYIRAVRDEAVSPEEKEALRNELHSRFAALHREEQRFAEIFLRDIDRGTVLLREGMSFRDYVMEYMARDVNDGIHRLAEGLGVDEAKLRALLAAHPNEATLNRNGEFEALCDTLQVDRATAYFFNTQHRDLPPYRVRCAARALLRTFILQRADYSAPDEYHAEAAEKREL